MNISQEEYLRQMGHTTKWRRITLYLMFKFAGHLSDGCQKGKLSYNDALEQLKKDIDSKWEVLYANEKRGREVQDYQARTEQDESWRNSDCAGGAGENWTHDDQERETQRRTVADVKEPGPRENRKGDRRNKQNKPARTKKRSKQKA